jgi:L-ascorbate metabolism protein UlaG (beta-lactamase superfamily)
MLLTKYGHSCVRIDDGDRRLAIDPGVFSEVPTALDELDAVLITHEHPDHVDPDRLAAAARANPDLRIWAPKAVTDQLSRLPELAERLNPVGPGEEFSAGGLAVRTFGGQHALIHSSVPVVANVCYLIDGTIYHPGDSYVIPTVVVRAPRSFGIHDALVTEVGRNLYGSHLERVSAEYGVRYDYLQPGESVQL